MRLFHQYMEGFLQIELTGYGKERFLNLCLNKEIRLWELKKSSESYIFFISLKDFRKLKPILKKTETHLHIIKRCGMPFFFYTHRKQKCFVAGLFICLFCVYYMSLFIWDIHVSGSAYYTEDQIIDYIKNSYITQGTKIKDIDAQELEKDLMAYFDEIAWISCEIKGTQLRITLTETIVSDEVLVSDNPSDLVAAKDCEIVSLITRNGTPVVKVNDTVEKGDILISGTIHIYDDNNEVLETDYVAADGDIYGMVCYDYEDSFEMNYYEKQYSGNAKKTFLLQFGNKTYQLWNPKINYEYYDISEESYVEKLGQTFYLPFSVQAVSYLQYTPVLVSYSEEEALDKATKRLDAKLDELREKGVEILENNVKIEIKDQVCYAGGSLVVKEKVAVPKDLQIADAS